MNKIATIITLLGTLALLGASAPSVRAQAPSAPRRRAQLRALLVVFLLFLTTTMRVAGQGSRKDDIVFGPAGHPVAGATITVC